MIPNILKNYLKLLWKWRLSQINRFLPFSEWAWADYKFCTDLYIWLLERYSFCLSCFQIRYNLIIDALNLQQQQKQKGKHFCYFLYPTLQSPGPQPFPTWIATKLWPLLFLLFLQQNKCVLGRRSEGTDQIHNCVLGWRRFWTVNYPTRWSLYCHLDFKIQITENYNIVPC